MDVSLIIPAYNEEHRLATTLGVYGEALRERCADRFEIIVVANGCWDNTAGVAMAAAASIPQIKVIDIAAAVGKGGAVLEGFRQARGAQILFADADAATTPTSLLALLDHLDRNDVVIGSRHLPTSTVTTPQALQRRIFSRLFNLSVSLLYGLSYTDTQCGAKAFRRDAAQRLAQLVAETRWAFDVDVLRWAHALDLAVSEQPVVWADKAGSQLRVVSTIHEVLRSLWRMKRRDILVIGPVVAARMEA